MNGRAPVPAKGQKRPVAPNTSPASHLTAPPPEVERPVRYPLGYTDAERDAACADAERLGYRSSRVLKDPDAWEFDARAGSWVLKDKGRAEEAARSRQEAQESPLAIDGKTASENSPGSPQEAPGWRSVVVTQTFLEFFCGAGMAREGLGPQWACTFANDIDPSKARSYAANFGHVGLKVGDVAHLKLSDLPGAATLAWSSFPCQDVSLAGDRAGLGAARSGAFWPFWRLMQGLRAEGRAPKLIVIENVPGLITSHDGQDLDAICDALADADYRFGVVMIDAVLFVPQSRERIFIVAVDKALDVPDSIVTASPSLPFHPPQLVAACRRQKAQPIWWRLSVPPQRNTVFADLIENAPHGVAWHTQAETDRLIGMMAPVHIAKLDAAKRDGKRMVGSLYKRMRDEAGGRVQRVEIRFDDVAGCLRMPTGGSSRQTVMIVDGDTVRSRLLSPREAARLMGLPDSYKLPSNYNEAYGLMGDGVVVPAVRWLAEHILEFVSQGEAQDPQEAQESPSSPSAAQEAFQPGKGRQGPPGAA